MQNNNQTSIKHSPANFSGGIYCLGEVIFDMIFKTDEAKIIQDQEKFLCFEYGEKIAVKEFIETYGGSAFNVAVGLFKMDIEAKIISVVGTDIRGKRILKRIEKIGLDSSFLTKRKNAATKTSAILISPDGDRTILVYHGKKSFDEGLINWDKIEDNSWFYLGPLPDGTQGLIDKVVKMTKEKALKLVINPGVEQVKWGREGNERVITSSYLYILNTNEACDMLGAADETKALKKLINLGAERIIITKGEEGLIAHGTKNNYKLDAFKAEMIDSTGAGDSFNAGVIGALIKGRSFDEALLWGAINSASVVEKFGAQNGILNSREITKLIEAKETYRPIIF